MQGEITKARAAYQDFLTLWKDADPDIPISQASEDGVPETEIAAKEESPCWLGLCPHFLMRLSGALRRGQFRCTTRSIPRESSGRVNRVEYCGSIILASLRSVWVPGPTSLVSPAV